MKNLISLFTVLLLLSLSVNSFGQANTYTFSQSNGTYTPITPSGTPASSFATTFDDNQATYTMPFTFNFAGTGYTQVTVSSNGFLVFGNALSANSSGSAYVSFSDPTGIYLGGTVTQSGIAGMNEDWLAMALTTFTGTRTSGSNVITGVGVNNIAYTRLRLGMRVDGTGITAGTIITALDPSLGTVTLSSNATASGTTALTPRSSIVTQTLGGGTTQTFVIQYTDVRRFSTNGNGDSVYFQIRLNQANNVATAQTIDVVFGNVNTTQTTTFTAQSGIRTTTADFLSRTTTSDWTATTAGTNTQGCRFNSTVFPASGLTYTWTPLQPVNCSVQITNLNPTGTIASNCTPYNIAPSVKLKNLGTSSQTAITVRYQVPSESYDQTVAASDLINNGDETTVNFPNSLNVNSSGVKAVTITVNSTCNSGPEVYSATPSYTVANPNYGGPIGGYYFANSTSGASCAPNQPGFFWADTTGSTYLTENGNVTTPLTTGDLDDGAWVITPPFAGGDGVYYDGVCYTQFAIGTNGIIGMGPSTTGVTAFSTTDIPSGSAAKPAIFPMWYDQDWRLNVGGVAVKSLGYKVSGQKLIITYTHAPTFNSTLDPNDYVTYQVILEINIGCLPINSNILFQYDNTQSGSSFMTKYNNGATPPTLANHTVGIQNTLGTIATQYRRSVSGVLSNAGPLFGSPMSVAFGPNNNALPVELASFTSSTSGRDVTLNWTTTKETNNSGFDVERSVNGTWAKVGNVAGNGTTTSSTNYTFTDRNLASGKYNYRLKQIDFNGNFEYFNLSSEVNVGIPEKYNLSQNYPNPFNPSTTISYDLPFDSKVSIKLFDMSGREVSTLVNEVKTAGYYSVNFNASNLSSGVYFYRISAEGNGQNFVSTKKMMLVK